MFQLDKASINRWNYHSRSRSAIQTLQIDMNEWQEAFINSGNSDISFLLEIAQDLLDNRDVNKYDDIYNKFLSHFPNGIPKVNVYIPDYGSDKDILNRANDRLKMFVDNHPTQEYLDAISRGEEKIPELISSDPMRICI
jgi:hypothetical protein